MSEHPFVGLLAAALLSLVAHGVAYASLGYVPKQGTSPAPSRVSFRVQERPPPVPEKVAKAEPEVAKPPPQARPVPKSEPLPAAPPPPVDLTGVTLTNDSGSASWSSVVGNGAALAGPIAAIRNPATNAVAAVGPVAVPKPAPARAEPSIVALDDLSERPVPPALASVLRDNYPAEAKARGIGGSASVAAEVGPDGRIRNASVAGESFPGFGEACRRTLQGSRWSPPRDREGRAVSTRIRYTCRFVVER